MDKNKPKKTNVLEERNIRIEDYSKVSELHDDILELIGKSKIATMVAIGVLETAKQALFMDSIEE